jgi:hypothetical protein
MGRLRVVYRIFINLYFNYIGLDFIFNILKTFTDFIPFFEAKFNLKFINTTKTHAKFLTANKKLNTG